MLHYILQIIAFQLAFLLVYELLFKKETFFTANRVYLLLTPVLAMLLPLLKLEFLQQAIPAEGLVMLPEIIIGENKATVVAADSGVVASETGWTVNWWLLTYAGGFLFSLGIFFNKFRVLKQLFSNYPKIKKAEVNIVEIPNSRLACTFYSTIFLGADLSEKEREQILSHELVHVRQKHTLDLLFFEVLKIFMWFNPLVYIYQNRISTLHEFLADAGVVKNVKKQEYFGQLLNSAFNTEDISFINQFFNHSIIKKRIVMLQKSKSRSVLKFKFLIIIPLMLAMMTYVSCSQDPVGSEEEKEANAQEKLEQIKAIVNNGTEITAEDKEEIKEILSTISMEELEKARNKSEKVQVQKLKEATSGVGDIPFAVIDEVPVFPGCETFELNEDRKKCMTDKVNELVTKNFNTSLGQELNLTGINRVYVQFKINAVGAVEIMGVRAKHPQLEEEARRVVNMIPAMTPGKQQGKEVGVLYSLPITFRVGE